MITVPTTLVLGAGASKPYGYPLGEELITDMAQGKFGLFDRLLELGFEQDEIEDFQQSLLQSGLGSIDAYLARVERHAHIGKLALAHQMLHYEAAATNFATDWLGYLWRLIVEDVQKPNDLDKNRLSIVTFNYDTSFERFLVNAIRSTFDIPTRAACDVAKAIPVVHVYGSLPVQETLRRLAPITPSLAATRTTADRLIVLHEGVIDSSELIAAREFLDNAQFRAFLGFGYLKENVTRLKVDTWLRAGSWEPFGTTFGMSTGEIERTQRMFLPPSHRLSDLNADCLGGVRAWVSYMTS